MKKIIMMTSFFVFANQLSASNIELNILNMIKNGGNNIQQLKKDNNNKQNNDTVKIDEYLEVSKDYQEEKKIKEKVAGLEKLQSKLEEFRKVYALNPKFISFGKEYFNYLTALYKPPYVEPKKSVTFIDEKKLKEEVIRNIKKAYNYYYYYYKVFYFLPNFFRYDTKKINELPYILRIAFEIKDTELYLNFFKYFIKDPVMFEKNYGIYARNILDKYYEYLKPYIKPLKQQEEKFNKYVKESNFVKGQLLNNYVLSEYIIRNKSIPNNIKNMAMLNLKYFSLLVYTRNVRYLNEIEKVSKLLNLYITTKPNFKINYIAFYKYYSQYYYSQLLKMIYHK